MGFLIRITIFTCSTRLRSSTGAIPLAFWICLAGAIRAEEDQVDRGDRNR